MHKRLGTLINKQEELFIHYFTLQIHGLYFSRLDANHEGSVNNGDGGDGELVRVDK